MLKEPSLPRVEGVRPPREKSQKQEWAPPDAGLQARVSLVPILPSHKAHHSCACHFELGFCSLLTRVPGDPAAYRIRVQVTWNLTPLDSRTPGSELGGVPTFLGSQ